MTAVVNREYTVVKDNDIPVVVTVGNNNTVTVEGKTPAVIVTGMLGPPGVNKIADMSDIDFTGLQQDSILMYDTSSNKWKPSKKLETHLINAGFF